MKMLYSICGIGLGHATRSFAVIKELESKLDLKIVSYGDALPYLKTYFKNVSEIEGYTYKGKYVFNVLYNVLETLKEPNKITKSYKGLREVADLFKPDVIFSDSEPNAFFYAHRRGLKNFVLLNLITTINNFKRIPKNLVTRDLTLQRLMVNKLVNFMCKHSDVVFSPTFERQVRYKENVVYTDAIVRKKPSDLPNEKELREKLNLPKETYYVHVGGADIEKHLLPILLKVLPNFEDKFFVIASNYIKKESVEKNMHIFPFIHDVFPYLKVAKGVISPAGHSTISEALVFKKPIMVIPIINHIEQMVNASLIEYEGYGKAGFFKRLPSPSMLKVYLNDFFENLDIYNKNLKGLKLKGRGAQQIAKKVFDLIK